MKQQTGKVTVGALLIGLLALLLVVMVGLNLYLLLRDDGAQHEAPTVEEQAPMEITEPVFVEVGPMTVNVDSADLGERLLYISLMIKVGSEETAKFLRTHLPDINNRLLILLSAQQAEQLTAAQGKKALAKQILEALQEPLADPQPELSLEAVLFQDFIVQ